jgi:putative oxidoreductase
MSVGLAIIRVVLGLYLTTHGLQKASSRLGFGGISGTAEGFARAGMRGGRFPAVLTAVLQLGAGILLAIGLLTPLAAMAAAGVMIVATQTRLRAGFWAQRGGFEYPALLAITSLAFIWSGGGRYSVDAAIPLHALDWPLTLAATLITTVAATGTTSVLRDRHRLTKVTRRPEASNADVAGNLREHLGRLTSWL